VTRTAISLFLLLGLVGCGDHGGSGQPGRLCGVDGTRLCGEVCVELLDDPENCGACGNDCEGAACADGMCVPVTIADLPGAPSSLLRDGDDLLVATSGARSANGAVHRVPAAGGASSVVYRGLGVRPELGRSPDGILVADTGEVGSCERATRSGVIVSIGAQGAAVRAASLLCPAAPLSHDGALIWIQGGNGGTTNNDGPWIGRLERGAAPGAAPSNLHASGGIRDLTLVGDTLRWIDATTGALMELPAAGGTATVAIPGVAAYAIDETALTYVGAEGIRRRSLATGVEIDIVAPIGGPLAADDTATYIGSSSGIWGAPHAAPYDGRMLTRAMTFDLAQDDGHLYFLVPTGDAPDERTLVQRIPKPRAAGYGPEIDRGPYWSCPAAFEACGDEFQDCVDLAADPTSCGACGLVCGVGKACTDGACTCRPSSLLCGGTCVDPATDIDNCGACGRSCGGGTCTGGDCSAVSIGAATRVATQDADAVYAAPGNAIVRLDKATGAATTLAQLVLVTDLIADATALYAIDSDTIAGGLYGLAKGSIGPATRLYPGGAHAEDLARVGDQLVWVESPGDSSRRRVEIVHGPVTGAARPVGRFAAPGYLARDYQSPSVAVVAHGAVVYWLLGDHGEDRGTVYRVDVSTPVPTAEVVVELDQVGNGLTIAGDRLYVTVGRQEVDGALLSMPLAGGPLVEHTRGLGWPHHPRVASDGTIYWISGYPTSDALRALAPGALVPRLIQGDLSGATVLLVDDARIYTSTYSDAGLTATVR
jgi:hypothetical protein